MRRSMWVPWLVVPFLLAGCMHTVGSESPPFDSGISYREVDPGDLLVEVHNAHWLPMGIWVEWPEMRRFLGDVAPGASVSFPLPRDLVLRYGALRLHADCRGSIDEVLTDPINALEGRRIDWTLRKVLANSRPRVM